MSERRGDTGGERGGINGVVEDELWGGLIGT